MGVASAKSRVESRVLCSSWGGVIKCHVFMTIVHRTRMRVSRIRDSCPVSVNHVFEINTYIVR